ncbi:zinc finger MYM-type protein 1-like [Ixodes scapularis]
MSGRFSGVQKRIANVQPKSVYIHCSNHSLDLALQEVGRGNELVADALTTVKDVSNIILDSAKRKSVYSNIVLPSMGENSDRGPPPAALLSLCPTRWVVRVKSVQRFLENYERVRATLWEILKTPGSVRDDRKAAMRGYEKILGNLETVLRLNVAIAVFGPCEELARTLQGVHYSATGARQAAKILTQTLTQLRSDVSFKSIWEESNDAAEKLGLKQPSAKPPRPAKPPARFEQTSTPARPAVLDAKTRLRKEYSAAIDCVTSEISSRFDQPGMERLATLENVLIHTAAGQHFSAERLRDELGSHAPDFELGRLGAQLMLLPTISAAPMKKVEDLVQALNENSQTVRNLLDQVVALLELLLTVPASAATGERSFSALERVQTCLRNRMTQKRLGQLLLLHVHKEKTRQLDLNAVMGEFVSRTAERSATFGVIAQLAS